MDLHTLGTYFFDSNFLFLLMAAGVPLLLSFSIGLAIDDDWGWMRVLFFGAFCAFYFVVRDNGNLFAHDYFTNLFTELIGALLIAAFFTEFAREFGGVFVATVTILSVMVVGLMLNAIQTNDGLSLNLSTELLGALFVAALLQPYKIEQHGSRILARHRRKSANSTASLLLLHGATSQDILTTIAELRNRQLHVEPIRSKEQSNGSWECVVAVTLQEKTFLKEDELVSGREAIVYVRAEASVAEHLQDVLQETMRQCSKPMQLHVPDNRQQFWRFVVLPPRRTGRLR